MHISIASMVHNETMYIKGKEWTIYFGLSPRIKDFPDGTELQIKFVD